MRSPFEVYAFVTGDPVDGWNVGHVLAASGFAADAHLYLGSNLNNWPVRIPTPLGYRGLLVLRGREGKTPEWSRPDELDLLQLRDIPERGPIVAVA